MEYDTNYCIDSFLNFQGRGNEKFTQEHQLVAADIYLHVKKSERHAREQRESISNHSKMLFKKANSAQFRFICLL